MRAPKISIITPCYNHARFLSDAIQSTLGQGYSNLEYIVMDGGSTDGSVEIIQKHARHLAYWSSARDSGMYHAVNAGMARATGDILAWLNADDFYLPGAFEFAAAQLDILRAEVCFGNAFHFVEGSAENWGSDVERAHAEKDLRKFDYIIQPAAFWTRRAWKQTGALDESLEYVADWDWFVRAQQRGAVLKPRARYLAAYRIVPQSRTVTGRAARWAEHTRLLGANVSEEYARVFQMLADTRDPILRARRFLRKYRLARLERPVFRLLYPRIFGRVSYRDACDMLESIGVREF